MINRVRIQNFRSLVDVTVDLDPLSVLIGRSGTGKSTFVQAIRFLRDCLNRRAVAFASAGGHDGLLHVRHGKGDLRYDLALAVGGPDGDLGYSLSIQPNGSIAEERLALGEDT